MARMNADALKFARDVLDERQRRDCKHKKIKYKGRYCEDGGYNRVDGDGVVCRGGLVVHHRNGDYNDNPKDGSNWEYVCRGHNIRKDNRGISRGSNRNPVIFKGVKILLKRVRENGKSVDSKEVKKGGPEIEKNKRCLEFVVVLAQETLKTEVQAELRGLCNDLAAATHNKYGIGNGVDAQTVRRWMEQFAGPRLGKFDIYEQEVDGEREKYVRIRGER